MNRLLLTVGRKQCPFGCTYCFTDFSQYERPLTVEDVERDPTSLNGVDVIYPACDVDLFALKRWPQILRKAVALGPSVSLSTKAALSLEEVEHLRQAANRMEARGALLKVSVSVSTKSRCETLEPRAPLYTERLQTLELLANAGIPTSLVLRPLLVDVPSSEYESIVADAAFFTNCILIGPEHLDDDPAHARRHARAPHLPPRKQAVNWAVNAPIWTSRAAPVQERAVRNSAARMGMSVFETDICLMQALMLRHALSRDGAATG